MAEPLEPSAAQGAHRVYRLPGGRPLRVRGQRRPAEPEVHTEDGWRRVGHPELVKLVAEELVRHTGLSNPDLPTEMIDSRDAVAALLTARARVAPPDDAYLRSEQSLITGHPHHPAPKARGCGPVADWLPYAPEAHARFPLTLLGLREDAVVDEGDTSALDALGEAPPGYRLLPAHPWQLDLVAPALAPAFADGRLIRLGDTAFETWPTAAIRTVYAPGRDLFLKFSLDVRITNDIHAAVAARPAEAPPDGHGGTRGPRLVRRPGGLAERQGYRTADFAFEELAVLVRDGLRGHLVPGATPLLAAGLVEGFGGSPLDGARDPAAWWEAYLAQVVPPALAAFADHGVVLEAHLQNTLVAVDADGTPVQALFRDAEGVKLLPEVSRAAKLGATRVLPGRQPPRRDRRGSGRTHARPRSLASRPPRAVPARPPGDRRPAHLAHPARQDEPAAALDRRGRRRRPLPTAAQPPRRSDRLSAVVHVPPLVRHPPRCHAHDTCLRKHAEGVMTSGHRPIRPAADDTPHGRRQPAPHTTEGT